MESIDNRKYYADEWEDGDSSATCKYVISRFYLY